MSAAWWGVVLIGGGGGLLVIWFAYALWEHRRRGEQSGTVSRAAISVLRENIGKQRRAQVRGVVTLAIGLVLLLAVLVFVAWAEGRDWFTWGR